MDNLRGINIKQSNNFKVSLKADLCKVSLSGVNNCKVSIKISPDVKVSEYYLRVNPNNVTWAYPDYTTDVNVYSNTDWNTI